MPISLKSRFLDKLRSIREQNASDDDFLGVIVLMYRAIGSALATLRGKQNVLKQKIVKFMLAVGLSKYVVKRTEAQLIYELKLPNDEVGSLLGGSVIRLMEKHGAFDDKELNVRQLIQAATTTTRTYTLTDKAKKLIRSKPELLAEVLGLLEVKPKLDVGPITKKTREGK